MIFCIVSIIYVFFIAEPVYLSTATFISSGSSDSNNSQMMNLANQIGFSLSVDKSNTEWSYEEVIKSRTMAKKLLKYRFDTNKFGPNMELLQILTYGNKKPELSRDKLEALAIESFQESIEINRDIKSSVYTLKVGTIESKLSHKVANIMIEELDEFQWEYNTKKTIETRNFIEDRLVETKKELEATEESLKEFREGNRSIFDSPQLLLEQERLKRDVAVLISVFTTLKQQLEMIKIEAVKKIDYIVVLDKPEISIYANEPKKRFLTILAGILGVGCGLIVIFVREYFENSSSEDQKKIFQIKSFFYKNVLFFIPFKKAAKIKQNNN